MPGNVRPISKEPVVDAGHGVAVAPNFNVNLNEFFKSTIAPFAGMEPELTVCIPPDPIEPFPLILVNATLVPAGNGLPNSSLMTVVISLVLPHTPAKLPVKLIS